MSKVRSLRESVEFFLSYIQRLILYVSDIYFTRVRQEKQYKFVIGVDEIANNIFFLKNIFNDNAVSVSLTRNKFYLNNKYDYTIGFENKYIHYLYHIFYGPYLLTKLANQSDVFIYFWYTGFCIDREIDYKFLKYKKKKIVCIFVGDDIRSRKLLKEKALKEKFDSYVFYDQYDFEKSEKRIKKVAYLADKYADLVFYPRSAQTSYLKKSVDNFVYMIDNKIFNEDKFIIKKDTKIKILHAPSNPALKGTPLVRAAIKKLELEGYNFEYIELIDKPNEEVLKLLKESHIVLNQFYATMPGLFGIEAMATKNAVLMSAKYEFLPTKEEKPWLKTGYWEVYDNLKYLLDNPKIVETYANAGFNFVKNNYTEEKVKNYYISEFKKHNII